MKKLIALAVVTLTILAFAPAHADGTMIVAGYTDPYTGLYTTPVSIVPAGSSVTFGNTDLRPRGVESDAIGPDTNPWCALGRYAPGHCPLFWARAQDVLYHSVPVYGVAQLPPGQYTFHDFKTFPTDPTITGTLIVQ
ncbi:MAG: hypothetical protein ACYDCC_08640 [Actinomycetota bacterium]